LNSTLQSGWNVDRDKQEVIDELRSFSSDCDHLLTMLGQGALQGRQQSHAQSRLRRIKRRLHERINEFEKSRQEPNDYQTRFLYPALTEALAKMQISDEATPVAAEWRDELFQVGREFTQRLDQLENA
jgi:hypothetical protein